MQYIHPLTRRKTSVSLPRASYRRVCAARKIFRRNGVDLSEQEIYRRLFKFFLKNWRGRGMKTNRLRRYNAEGKSYAIHPLYINQVLYAALWERSLHSGESVSRMLDVAIRVYLPRLLENLLRVEQPGVTAKSNTVYWGMRYDRRPCKYPDFFINYNCQTRHNDENALVYSQSTRIISRSGLSAMQIEDLLHKAA